MSVPAEPAGTSPSLVVILATAPTPASGPLGTVLAVLGVAAEDMPNPTVATIATSAAGATGTAGAASGCLGAGHAAVAAIAGAATAAGAALCAVAREIDRSEKVRVVADDNAHAARGAQRRRHRVIVIDDQVPVDTVFASAVRREAAGANRHPAPQRLGLIGAVPDFQRPPVGVQHYHIRGHRTAREST